MARERRERGEGAVYYSKERQRWVGQLDLGIATSGKRMRPAVFGNSHQEVKDKLAAPPLYDCGVITVRLRG